MSRSAVVLDDPIPPLVSSGMPSLSACLPPHCSTTDVSSEGATPSPPPLCPAVYIGSGLPPPDAAVRIGDGAVVSGNMTQLSFQGYTVIGRRAVVRPPLRSTMNAPVAQCPEALAIGAFTTIGAEAVCEAAGIGRFVRVDARAVVECGARVPDGVWVRAGSWVPPEAVLAPFTVYAGCPAAPLGRLDPDACRLAQMEHVRNLLAAGA